MSDVHVICQSANFVSARLCPNLDYETTSSQPDKNAFDTKLYFDNLNTERIGRLCLYAGTVSSTFDLLPKKSPFFDGIVALADRQTTGRGRGGNVWLSPVGCAMFSLQLGTILM